eukprot:SAG31_NODE_25251_length_465_cov_0.633880_1_plen_146_part_01
MCPRTWAIAGQATHTFPVINAVANLMCGWLSNSWGPSPFSYCIFLSGLLDVVMKQKQLMSEQTEIFNSMTAAMSESIESEMDLMLSTEYWNALGNRFVDDVGQVIFALHWCPEMILPCLLQNENGLPSIERRRFLAVGRQNWRKND